MRNVKSQVFLDTVSRAYLIGIKGVGMTALAQILKARGIRVSGSDTPEHFFTDAVLKRHNIPVRKGFRKENIPSGVDMVISSAAYYDPRKKSSSHPEIREALRRHIPVYTYPEALGILSRDSISLLVSGTHGKSTTTAMLGLILEKSGLDPEVVVGTRVNEWGGNARAGSRRKERKPLFVLEADEYKEAFLNYHPYGVIITSIEFDHPDYYKNVSHYKHAFRKLVERVPKEGFIVANRDDSNVRDVVGRAKCRVVWYGRKSMVSFPLGVPGEFNRMNATSAFLAAGLMGAKKSPAKKALKMFEGTARRFEVILERPVRVIDDYAHHPSEVHATLGAARALWPKKTIWSVFQPHTFSRTKALKKEFSRAFGDASRLLLLDIYGSMRESKGNISSQDLLRDIRKNMGQAFYTPGLHDAKDMLVKQIKPGDVIITMGAGDVWRVGRMLKTYIQKRKLFSRYSYSKIKRK